MEKLKLNDVTEYVEINIGSFHKKRLKSLEKLQFKKILQRKNPYLFRPDSLVNSKF